MRVKRRVAGETHGGGAHSRFESVFWELHDAGA